MFKYWKLVGNLPVKEFKLRYRNSTLNFLWSLLNTPAMMLILTVVFSTLRALRGRVLKRLVSNKVDLMIA